MTAANQTMTERITKNDNHLECACRQERRRDARATSENARATSANARVFRRRLQSFTLVEMIVAIGAAALVIAGIGQVFASVSGIVSVGSAVAEVNQLARSIEKQMRQDFEAFSRLPDDETFLAIRMREIGSTDDPIYLNPEDRAADDNDINAGLFTDPYEWDTKNKRLKGRAVHRRLDELVFLAFDNRNGGFRTMQAAGASGEQAPPTPFARIYYGQALKPAPDPDFPPKDFDTIVETQGVIPTPQRQWLPDGDFGQRSGEDNLVTKSFGGALDAGDKFRLVSNEARNEYAGAWTLTRQPLLLFGGKAAGPGQRPTTRGQAIIGNDREYAPYIRDMETLNRFWGTLNLSGFIDLPGPASKTPREKPEPRLIRHGRVDICAQDALDVRRWLEGERPLDPANPSPPQALAFSSGRFYAPRDPFGDFGDNVFVRQPLWTRIKNMTPTDKATIPNRAGIRAAIAGVFARPLQIASPPVIDRAPDPNDPNAQQSEDALMDTHAVLAARCSSFAIAWSDGSKALRTIDFDGDNIPDVRRGDLIWFDISRVRPQDANKRDAARFTWAEAHALYGPQGSAVLNGVAFQHVYDEWSPGGTPGERRNIGNLNNNNPRPGPGLVDNPNASDSISALFMHTVFGSQYADTSIPQLAAYNPDITGGVPSEAKTDDANEWIFIWPFRVPNGDGEYVDSDGVSKPWPKNILLRVRMTLHDSKGTLKNGRDFEFVFDLSPRRSS